MESTISTLSEHQPKLATSVHLGAITATKGNGIGSLKLSQLVEGNGGTVSLIDTNSTNPSPNNVSVNLVDALQHDDNNNHKQIYIHLNELTGSEDDECPKNGNGTTIYGRLAAAAANVNADNSSGVVSVLSGPPGNNEHNGISMDQQALKIIVQNGNGTLEMTDIGKNEGSLLLNMNGAHAITSTEQQIQHHQLTTHSHLGGHHTTQTTPAAQALSQQHLYDYYKLPLMVDGTTKAITLVTPDGKSVVAAPDGTLQEMVWSAVPVSVSCASDGVHGSTTIVPSNGSLSSSPNRPSEDDHSCANGNSTNGTVTSSPTDHHHSSPSCLIKLEPNDDSNLLLGDSTTDPNGNTVDSTGQNVLRLDQSDAIDSSDTTVLHPCEVHVKSESFDGMPSLSSPAQMTLDVLQPASVERTRELEPSPPTTVISLAPAAAYQAAAQTNPAQSNTLTTVTTGAPTIQSAQLTFAAGPTTYDLTGNAQYVHMNSNNVSPQYNASSNGIARQSNGSVYITSDYLTYREFIPNGGATTSDGQNNIVFAQNPQGPYRQHLVTSPVSGNTYNTATSNQDGTDGGFIDRYLRQPNGNLLPAGVITTSVSPTSMTISDGQTMAAQPENAKHAQVFEYNQLTVQPQNLSVDLSTSQSPNSLVVVSPSVAPAQICKAGSRRSWNDYARNSEVDKVHIEKLQSDVGFKYFLESPISTSVRREDDRVTYINKGQFYGISLEYMPDLAKPLKTGTVRTVVMLVFREEKSHEEEMKAWQFWHSRQHSSKQRILDADTKNSSGIISQIEEISHNAIAFYWSPSEATAKVNIAVQCLSTDFSNQKGVKGLPLHIQIDTFDDISENATPIHRGYAQIKVFCDKGAERKTRDEERRANKRKLAISDGRKKIEDMYHQSCDRSEFYSMADLLKPAILFNPSDDMEKITPSDLSGFYNPTDLGDRDSLCDIVSPPKKPKIERYPSTSERVLLYAKQENEEHFHPLHITPPTLVGLALAIENKYKLEAKNIRNIYKRHKKGNVTLQMDDAMVRYFSHEDIVLLEVRQINNETHDITLVEYDP